MGAAVGTGVGSGVGASVGAGVGAGSAVGSAVSTAGVGGASLAKGPKDVTLLDVFRAVEEKEDLFHFHENPNPKCPVGRNVHAVLDGQFRAVSDAMEHQLQSVTLQTIIDDMEKRIAAQNASA